MVMLFALLCACMLTAAAHYEAVYVIGNSTGRRFDGIGAISGGGATSKLLVNYPEPQRSQILDFLFKRNPDIRLYGLPWGFPGWLGDSDGFWPFQDYNATSRYVVDWVNGAKVHHGLDINYLGLWNEKYYDVGYILALRGELDARGFTHVDIVAADMVQGDNWDIVRELKDPRVNRSIAILGGHYVGAYSTEAAKDCGKPLWASEDYGHTADMEGAGCMARIINQNYVHGLLTSTIAWNLVASYYPALPDPAHSLMTAQQPWAGHYVVAPPIWATAHTTQFSAPGWHYGSSGTLAHGGTYVSLLSGQHLTIVIETMDSSSRDFCVRPPQSPQRVTAQNATLALTRGDVQRLYMWATHLDTNQYFLQQQPLQVRNGTVSLYLPSNSIVTLSTVSTAHKGTVASIPPPKPFPLPYAENFEGYRLNSEANNFAQQAGVFEIRPAPPVPSLRKEGAFSKSVSENSALEKSASGNSALEKSASENSALEKSASGNSALEKSASGNSALEKSASGNSALEKSASENSALEKSASGNSALEKSASGNSALEKSASGNSALEKSASGNSALEKSASGNSALEKSASGNSALEKSASGNSALAKSASENSALEKSASWNSALESAGGKGPGNSSIRQVLLQPPVHWCPVPIQQPITLIGNYNWSDITVSAAVHVPAHNGTRGVFVAARVDNGGCYVELSRGVFLWLLYHTQQVVVSSDIARGQRHFITAFPLFTDTWYTLSLTVKGDVVTVAVEGNVLFSRPVTGIPRHGFSALGTDTFQHAHFDAFSLTAPL